MDILFNQDPYHIGNTDIILPTFNNNEHSSTEGRLRSVMDTLFNQNPYHFGNTDTDIITDPIITNTINQDTNTLLLINDTIPTDTSTI